MLGLHKSLVLQSARLYGCLQRSTSRGSQNCRAIAIRLSSSNTIPHANERKPYESLENDHTWEADILRHEKKLVQLLKRGVKPEELPSHERDQKVDILPHLVFKNTKDSVKDDSILDSTSKLILGNRTPEESSSDKLQDETNIDPDFAREEVQELLTRIHFRCDLGQVYGYNIAERKEMPRIRYLTSEQLIEEKEKFNEKLQEKIRMPSIMKERKQCDVVLAKDDVLQNYEDSNVCFVDISEDKPDRECYIIVREPSGVLRTGNWDERDRLLQVYFPREGKHILPPNVFKDEYLKNSFEQGLHRNLLDRCVVQFEADSSDYIRVFEKVYENVNEQKIYKDLRSTRYYGGLVFYLTKNKLMDDLLEYALNKSMIEDASDIVQLFVLLHPKSRTSEEAYIENDSHDIKGLSKLLHTHFASKQS